MKLISRPGPIRCSIADMPHGSLGYLENGDVYFRMMDSAACLTNHGRSFTNSAGQIHDKFVMLFDAGTKLTFEV